MGLNPQCIDEGQSRVHRDDDDDDDNMDDDYNEQGLRKYWNNV